MRLVNAAVLAGGVGLIAGSASAAGAELYPGQNVFNLLQRISGHYSILLTRSLVDLTYDSITVEPGSGSLVITGLTVYPEFEWDENFECEITMDRAVLGSIYGFETVSTNIELSGVTVPPACVDPGAAGMLTGFGYGDGVVAESMSIEIAYDLPSSAADITVQAAVEDAADISLAASFNYLWVRFPTDGGDEPIPVAVLGDAELTVENGGLWERVEPMVAAQMGDVNAIPSMAQLMLGQMLGEPGGQPAPEIQAFADNVSAELARFIENKDRLVLRVAPEGGLFLDENTFSGPAEAIKLLQPVLSGIPASYRALVQPDELAAALAGGNGMSDEAKLRVGEALLTGIGAPRSPAHAETLLGALADAWNGDAAHLVADARVAAGDEVGAYAMTMRALAGSAAGAIGAADTLETQIEVVEILSAQETARDAWPGASDFDAAITAMVAQGDISGLRRMALNAAVGKGMPRDYATAYYLASLASAGGDRGAANLIRRLDAQFKASDSDAWRADAAAAAAAALETWSAGLGATIAARVR